MARSTIEFTGDVALFEKFTNPETWKGNLAKNIKRATLRNALFLIKEIKRNIKEQNFAENAPLTLALRRNTKPLLDQKNLFDAIDSVLLDSFSVEVGIIKNSGSTGSKFGKAKSQINIKDLVELMEEGYVITVTEKMKKAVAASLNSDRNKKGKIKPGSKRALKRLGQIFGGKTYIVPPRPLLSKVFEDPKIERVLQRNWKNGLEGAFKDSGAKGGEHKDR